MADFVPRSIGQINETYENIAQETRYVEQILHNAQMVPGVTPDAQQMVHPGAIQGQQPYMPPPVPQDTYASAPPPQQPIAHTPVPPHAPHQTYMPPPVQPEVYGHVQPMMPHDQYMQAPPVSMPQPQAFPQTPPVAVPPPSAVQVPPQPAPQPVIPPAPQPVAPQPVPPPVALTQPAPPVAHQVQPPPQVIQSTQPAPPVAAVHAPPVAPPVQPAPLPVAPPQPQPMAPPVTQPDPMVHPVAPPVPVPQPVVQPVMQPEPQPQPVVQPVPAPPQMVQPAPQLVASPLTPDVPIESMTDDELIAFLSNSMAETGAVVQGDSLLSLEELNARFLAEARAGESAPFAPISESFDVISPAMTGFAPDDSLSVTQYTGATAAIDGETLMVPSAETTTLIPDDSTMISAFHDLDESDQKSSKIRKPLWILGIVLWVTTVILLLMTTFGFMTYNNEVTKFGNYGIYYQRSETMEPDVPYGSLVVATKLKEGEGKLGDNVLFGIDPTGASDKVVLRRIVNVLRIDTQVDYDTILLTDRDTSREQFSSDQALMILRFAIPGLGFLIDLLIANVWWLIGAFVASLVLVGVFRPRRKEKDYVLQ